MSATVNRDPFRIFLSGSSADFAHVRIGFSKALARGQLHIIHQANFPQSQADTVLKLAQLIAPCGILVHLIGRQPGSIADPAAVAEYLAYAEREGGFLHTLPDLRTALGDCSGITYTQWEVLIALHLGIHVFVYGDATHADPAHPQRQHIDRLISARRYTDTFSDPADLKDKVWADLLWHYRQTLPAAQLPEIFRPSNLPGIYAGSLFLGRDDFLLKLRASLVKKANATAITHTAAAAGIAGLGGVGKTHAAIEYARRHQADYTATLFVSGDSPDRLNSSFSALFDVLHLGSPNEVQRDQSVRITAVKNWFTSHRDWLLIADNVDDKTAAATLTSYFGSLATGHVLITSCLQNWGKNVEALNIEVLSPADSTELLLQLTEEKRQRTDDEAAQARRLADLLEGLPLALHQAAGYINEQRLTFADYIAQYEEEATGLLHWFESHLIPYQRLDYDTPKPVLITWKTSFVKLDPDTRFWLLVFAHFASDPIPEFLLDFAPDEEDEVKTRHRSAKRALAQAETYSLLTRYEDPPRFKLHRLVQHILRLTTSEPDRIAALAMGIQIFVENDPGDPTDVRTWKQWNPLQSHAVSFVAHAPDVPAPERLSWLLNQLAVLLSTKSLHAEAEPLMRRALVIDETSFGKDHPAVATRLNNLAQLLNDTNRLTEAEPLMRRALAIDEAGFGSDHPAVALDLNNLAALLKATNRLAEAEPLMRRALVIDEVSFGKDHPNVSRDLNNLAGLLKATNRLAEAEPLMRRALVIVEASYGPDHPNVAIRLNNLAGLLQDTNRPTEAEPLMRRALAINEVSYGPEHPAVAIDLNNLVTFLQDTNRVAEAEPLMRRALAIDEVSYGKDHPNVAIRLNNLVTLFYETNRLAEAEPLMRRALAIDEVSYGKDHPNVSRDLNNLAQLLQATKRRAEAEPLMRRALTIDEASFGKDHPTVANRLNNLAQLLKDTNRLSEAEPLMRRALTIDEASYGPEHPNVAIHLNNLAQLLQDTKRLAEAEPLMRRAVLIFAQFTARSDYEHPHLQVACRNYHGLLAANGLTEKQARDGVFAALREGGLDVPG